MSIMLRLVMSIVTLAIGGYSIWSMEKYLREYFLFDREKEQMRCLEAVVVIVMIFAIVILGMDIRWVLKNF